MKPIDIEKALEADVPVLAAYRYAMFQEMHPGEDFALGRHEFLLATEAYYRQSIRDGAEANVCARDGTGRVIGCGTITFQQRPPHNRHPKYLTAYILNIYVHPNFRRQGVARRIMESLLGEAKARGAVRVGLTSSQAGLELYKKLGFAPRPDYLEISL